MKNFKILFSFILLATTNELWKKRARRKRRNRNKLYTDFQYTSDSAVTNEENAETKSRN